MTESKQSKSADQPKSSDQSTGTADRPAAAQPATASAGQVFGDGSTSEQQQQLVREAEQANAETKRFADAEREARSQ